MAKVRAFDIFWDTEGHDINLLGLPRDVAITISEDTELDDDIVIEAIQDTYGDWPINSLEYEVIE